MDASTGQSEGIARLLRRHRTRLGLTQEALAERAGVSARGVQDIERGLSIPHRSTVLRLGEALELQPDQRRDFLEVATVGSRTSSNERRTTLPAYWTSFIGRERETAEITRLLGTTRLLTLTGPGGVGKTRLALRVGESLVDSYADGVWLVELASLADAGLVTQTVGRVLGVRELPGEPLLETLVSALQHRRLLLILDNCEHVLAACTELASRLLGGCRHVVILATSREVLGTGGETVWRVPPLSLPSAQAGASLEQVVATSEAAALFLERAEAALPGFAARSQNGAALAEVCGRLDGIPLAIELAAARVRLLGLDQLAERLGDRLRLLSTGNSAAPTRQQTLRATIGWSYDLLSESERRLFENLSVFAGGFTLEAAEAVGADATDSDDVVDLLGRLLDKSLVLAEPTPRRGLRYRLLETQRQYADEKLAERGTSRMIRQRHAGFFLRLFEDARREVFGASAEAWLQKLEDEHDNLRAALSWALAESEVETALRLAGSGYLLWYLRGYFSEGRDWLKQPLILEAEAAAHADTAELKTAPQTEARRLALRALVLHGAGNLAVQQSDFDAAHQAASESLQLWRQLHDEGSAAWPLSVLAVEALYRTDYSRARQLFRESVAAGTGTPHGQAIAAISLAMSMGPGIPGLAWPGENVVCQERPLSEVIAITEAALRTAQADEQRIAVCWFLLTLGALHSLRHDYAAARAFWEEGLVRTRETGFKHVMSLTLTKLGELATKQGDSARARSLLADSLKLTRELGDRVALANSLEAVLELAIAHGQSEPALKIAAAAGRLRQTTGLPLNPGDQIKLEGLLAAARERLDGVAAAAAWREGQALPVDTIIFHALEMLANVAEPLAEHEELASGS